MEESGLKRILNWEGIQERLSPIYQDDGLKLVLLFGSAVSEKTHRQSDIDLAFLYDKPAELLALINRVVKLLHFDRVDAVDLRSANTLLKFSIAKSSRVLYERSPGLFSEFYSLAFRMYVDSKKLREARSEAIKSFIEARGLA